MLKAKKKIIESILREHKWKYIACIYLYFIVSTLLKLSRSICLSSINDLVVSTIVIVFISLLDYILYTFVIHKSFEIVEEKKSKLHLRESLIFALVIVGFEYIFQYFLVLMNSHVMLMMSLTLALSMLRLMYLPFIHFLYFYIDKNEKVVQSVFKSMGLVLNNFMEILYFSVFYYFLNLFHNYIVYQLTVKFDITETVNVNELILYNDNRAAFILVEVLFYLLLAYTTSKIFVYLAYLFKQSLTSNVKKKKKKK